MGLDNNLHNKLENLDVKKVKPRELFLIAILPLTKPLIRLFVRWGISANQVTYLSFFFGLAAAGTILLRTKTGILLASIFMLVHIILDKCDGNVARVTGKTTDYGNWLDQVVGYITHSILFASIAAAVNTKLSFALAGVSISVYFFAYLLMFLLKTITSADVRKSRTLKSPISYAYGMSLISPALFISWLFNDILYVLYFFSIAGTLFLLLVLLFHYRTLRQIS